MAVAQVHEKVILTPGWFIKREIWYVTEYNGGEGHFRETRIETEILGLLERGQKLNLITLEIT